MCNNKNEETKKLSKYYVAYIDILGAKNFINSDKSEEYLNKIHNIYRECLKNLEDNISNIFFLKETHIKIFSDNIIIAIPQVEYFGDSENAMGSYYILLFALIFQIIALSRSILVRGSIISGDLYIDENFVYGPALTKAYELESQIANYSRIIINPANIHEFLTSDIQQEIIEKDLSNIFYINPFVYYFNVFNLPDKDGLVKCTHDSLIEILDNTPKNDKYVQKVCWFINLYNEYCTKNSYNEFVIDLGNYPYPLIVERHAYSGQMRELINGI